ncbi:ABC transporter ATP-binding protein [Aggregatibacter actinomycetemcomitans]|uniref:ABC transporter ATP-binding protein n=1 Tax=Aggregatibacter actinomycetemcomitans TaxID=714 RepID=UPI0004375648|nr:ABC transporter ATP-binding protein [Aggregatibacter actinomycetemcomitans]AHN72494.1 glycine betaine/L-proline transport ATP bindingsubunit, putative' [Aggregatibacter actinomycetemcomitans HK1651]QPQ81274.1 ABC transporter ATP-binding protein [Aggregatibacter actinomycetemcomitans]
MKSNRTPFIEFRGVSKYYDGQHAVQTLNLTIYQGEFFVLVGGSGSGKSTTLRMINALTEPTDGDVYFQGKRIKDYNIHTLRHRIGYVLQQIALFPTMTVAQNIALMPDILGWHKNERKSRVNTLLELVNLPPAQYQDRYPRELSGGEQQRIGILRAIAANPHLLLMDEPFSALDPLVRAALQDQISLIHKKFGTTIVFVTHDMQEALKLACRIGVMQNGKLVQVGKPNEIQQQPANSYVKSLFASSEQALTVEKVIMQYEQLSKTEQASVRKWLARNG